MALTKEADWSRDLPAAVSESVARLVGIAGDSASSIAVEPLALGGNNRVCLVDGAEGRYVAKWYYDDSAIFRERLRAEYDFLEHVWSHGVRCVPRPIARDAALQVAVYEYVPGRPVTRADVTRERTVAAGRFFAETNDAAVRASGAHLPAASDACFKIADQIDSVERRLERVAAIPVVGSADRAAAALVRDLVEKWAQVIERLAESTGGLDAPIPDAWRCISPSDFGFHNALLRTDGSVCFLDFEYAGWDDPAKMIADFFSHPGVAVPESHKSAFVETSLQPFPDAGRIAERAEILQDVARVRWCCIALNEFLPEVASRRRFADPRSDPEERKQRQLEKATAMCATIQS